MNDPALPLNALAFAAPEPAVCAAADATATPLVILHGLFGSSGNWRSMGQRLAEGRSVHALDLRNHGGSPWSDAMGWLAIADDLRRYQDDHALAPAIVLGHSLGGKAAMLHALRHPERVSALIVVDIAPADYEEHDHLPYIRAMQSLDLTELKRRAEADAPLAGAVPDLPTRQFLLQNLVARDGALHWRLNLAAIASALPELIGFPPEVADLVYTGPTLFLTGAYSDYVEPGHHDEIRRLFPQSRIEVIEGAGHRVHAEQPERFFRAVDRFLGTLTTT
ncbi:MAG: alpha/beta fold hydrolase [Azospirillum sp.]|nr:alpha/beta fold hydrolase [Azospirillum sp.]